MTIHLSNTIEQFQFEIGCYTNIVVLQIVKTFTIPTSNNFINVIIFTPLKSSDDS